MNEQHSAGSTETSKHTPGPWHLFPKNPLCIEARDGNVALVNLARSSEADARLIAAAPDLLEALKKLRAAVQDVLLPAMSAANLGTDELWAQMSWGDAVLKTDTAIAKAEGKS
jgi:hypothetical protein